MNRLAEILSSRTRAEIFRLLFSGTEEELHVREIERRSGLNDSTLRQELRKLVRLDLVQSRRDSNRVYYRAKTENPLYPEIRNLVLKTSGLSDVLKSALKDKRVRVAFVFGSIARGEENAGSDVDLMVIGQLGLRDLSRLLSGIEEKIGREVNPHVLREEEFRKRIRAKEHFASSVMEAPKIFIIGSERELETMGR
ncbi:MAG: helix-turn-helix domain-containing protein [Deltaproteobacteria bacterium]|jgi:predicted nucleotidyltransferase/DNA-binding HxlR family transcriptional regulator|nr:helix-turn-helix domain-containing protein [Deltaproteobacteria bacterium]